ncbi:MAG TPA: FtsX-like permease family protein [Pyrinomonadaceae bacterium]
MTTPTIKILRDFWQERARTLLVVIAIALGIAAFSAMMSSYAILTRELDHGYLATNPASAVIRMDAIDDDLIKTILADPSVSAAEPRRSISGQIKAGPFQWRNLVLFVVKDYANIQVNKLTPETGAWPPATGEILIERDAFQVAHAAVGDRVIVKTQNGTEQTLVISGGVHDVGQAQARMENIVYGYINVDTLAKLGEQPYLNELNILVAGDKFNEAHVRAVAGKVQTLIQARGHEVKRVDIPTPGKHPHSELMGILLLSMSAFGLFILLLSGILVVNLLTAIMASQVRQIGIMKAVGASRWQVCKIYLGEAALLGVAATVLAIPFGMIGSRILCRYLSYFLNFDINSFAVPVWVYLLVVLVGIITPLLAAAYPVWKGTRVPVRVAISDYNVSTNAFGAKSIDGLIARVGGNSRPFLISLRNSFRKRTRLVLTLLTLSAGGLSFMSALNVRASLINTLDHLFGARQFDLSVTFSSPQPIAKIDRAIQKTPGITSYEAWFVTEGAIDQSQTQSRSTDVHNNDVGEDTFTIIAFPADTKMLRSEITAGRGLQAGDTDAMVVNDALARRYPTMKVGNSINVRVGPTSTAWKIVGITREAFSPAIAYVPLNILQEYSGLTNSLRLILDRSDGDSIAAVKMALDKNLEQEGTRARGASGKADNRYAFDQHMVMIYVFLIITSVIVAGVGGLGLMTTMSVNVLERRRELGVLRAIGATPKMIGLIIVGEGVVIGLLSWVIAAALAWPVSRAVGDWIVGMLFRGGMDFVFDVRGLFIWLLVSIVFCAIATLLPAWRASRMTVRESLAYE